MDCCNYMPYRHHQYYASQYYEPVPAYHGDFYGQQVYHDYYGNAPYYQQWPCTTFPDYVYNPKEARIRKAMRDATRERTSIGTSPMLQRPNARRAPSSHSWVPPPPPSHDDLMMPPMGGLQGTPSVCAFPSPGEQFLGAMGAAYSKMEPAPPPPMPPPPTTSVHTNYMQSNPLAQLQQHTEMWPEYQAMRPRSSAHSAGNPFMMGDVPPYPAPPPEMGAPLMMEKEPTPAASPSTDAPEPDKGPEQEHFLPVFEPDENKMKKPAVKRPATKSLPDFNEAFGSTERGRFQSRPDPRLAPNKGYLDYFFESGPAIKFDDYHI